LDTVAEDENDIYDVFDLTDKIPSTVDELKYGIFYCEFKNHIKIWILGKLVEYNIDWVNNLTELDLRDNELTTLHESIGNLTQIQYIVLYNNSITDDERIILRKIFGTKVKF